MEEEAHEEAQEEAPKDEAEVEVDGQMQGQSLWIHLSSLDVVLGACSCGNGVPGEKTLVIRLSKCLFCHFR